MAHALSTSPSVSRSGKEVDRTEEESDSLQSLSNGVV